MRRATEGSGRYDHIHGDEDQFVPRENVSECGECGSVDGCLCAEHARQDAALERYEREHPRKTGHFCCVCNCDPCESPSGCRGEAERENEETEDCDG